MAKRGEGEADRDVDAVLDGVRELAGLDNDLDERAVRSQVQTWPRNTRRAFRSDLDIWLKRCRKKRLVARSVSPEAMASWFSELAGQRRGMEKTRSLATIERYLVNLGKAYRLAGAVDPTRSDPVRQQMKLVRENHRSRQRKATPIRFERQDTGIHLSILLDACGRDHIGLRDRAILLVAYDAACRRSELISISCAHIRGPKNDGSGALFIPAGGADDSGVGEGHLVSLTPTTMNAVARWRDAAGIRSGPLFRRIKKHFDGSTSSIGNESLHPNSVTLIYRRLVREAWSKGMLGDTGEDELERILKRISSHSIRAGAIHDFLSKGADTDRVMAACRCHDERSPLRYASDASGSSKE